VGEAGNVAGLSAARNKNAGRGVSRGRHRQKVGRGASQDPAAEGTTSRARARAGHTVSPLPSGYAVAFVPDALDLRFTWAGGKLVSGEWGSDRVTE